MIETSLIFEKIIKLLKENSVDFKLYEHEPVHTSEQAAKVRNIEMKQGAKAIIFSADPAFSEIGAKPILVVVPGDKKIDTKAFKKLYHIKDLKLLSPDEVRELTGLEIGAIPPFGNTMGLITYADQLVFENEKIAFNVGSHTKSVLMKSKDFKDLVNPIIDSFSL